MTLNHVIALILHYLAEFGIFRRWLHKSVSRYTHTFCDRNLAQRI